MRPLLRALHFLEGFMNKIALRNGFRDGIPIGLGYLAASFSVGIACQSNGLSAFQGFLLSLLNNASAGEYAGLTVMADDGSYMEMLVMTLVSNARYLLMSCVLSQRFSQNTPFYHRLLIGYDITDESFSAVVSRPGSIQPAYFYGMMAVMMPSWAMGTAAGVAVGNLLPPSAVSAFSVALYGMFISSFIPPARREKPVAFCVIAGFAASYLVSVLPCFAQLSSGMRIILLTVGISALAAAVFPLQDEQGGVEDAA